MLIPNLRLKIEKDQTDLDEFISKQSQIRGRIIDCAPQISRGNYYISKILELIETSLIWCLTIKHLKIDSYQYRVEINPNKHFAIDCYADR